MAPSKHPTYLNFESAKYPWKPGINYRSRPKLYRVGKGEQGVLICEPYKSELTPHWRFRTPAIAKRSATNIFKMFQDYLDQDEFVGADMARKFLQMGYTRARRYANYKGGKKYDKSKDYALNERDRGFTEGRECRNFLWILEKSRGGAAVCGAKEGMEKPFRLIRKTRQMREHPAGF